jgi:hypothetical protein
MGEQSSDSAHSKGDDAGSGQPVDRPSEVFWKNGVVTCLYKRHGAYSIEVRLILDDVVIQREFFADAESASQFALGKKRAYIGL